MSLSILFFFQAEDGIRDLYVTGVQTCALPISNMNLTTFTKCMAIVAVCVLLAACRKFDFKFRDPAQHRSEERRVGKSVDLGGGRIILKNKLDDVVYDRVLHLYAGNGTLGVDAL